MKKIILFCVITLVVTGCTTTGARKMSYEEAAAFENSLLARESQIIEQPEKLFTQPVNKTEPCQLPTTQDQLDRRNFRAFWDGECKNGFAYGLGRDIAISDTHHYEEITIHNGNDQFNANRPYVWYDFVNNRTYHGVSGKKYPAKSGAYQRITNNTENFNIDYFLDLTDESGNWFALRSSPFKPEKIYINRQGSVGYQLVDFTDWPTASNSTSEVIEIFNGKTGVAGGVRMLRFKNSSFEHQKLGSNGQVAERVAVPQEYIEHLLSKIMETDKAISLAKTSVQKAQQIEREYLYMACNGKHRIEGLDNETATKICTWQDQFKDSYATASADYQRRLDNMRQQAAIDEQRLQIQQQIIFQQEQAQAEANTKALDSLNQTLKDTNESMRKNIPTSTRTKCRNTLSGIDCNSTSF